MDVLIIIPAYNEEQSIASIVKRAKKYGKVIVVDDASKDDTYKTAKEAGALVIRHKINHGLGSALRSGFDEALKRDADVIITLDGDGQHNPDEIPLFVEKIKDGYDFVLGGRDLSKYPFIKKFGNFFLQMATNFISNTRLKDTESGYRAFNKNALKKLYLKAERYEIAVEIIFEVGRNRLKAINIPVSSGAYVKGVGVIDGFKNFSYLLRRRKRAGIRNYLEDIRYVLRRKL